jgi:hypothetical protein
MNTPATKRIPIIFFVAVFTVETLVTSFAFALTTTGQGKAEFIPRMLDFALHFAWSAGIAITAVIWILSRRTRPPPPEISQSPRGE